MRIMSEPQNPQQIIERLIAVKLNGKLITCERVLLGYFGYVYKVEAVLRDKRETLAVKLNDVFIDQTEEERINNRVYGTAYEDFKSVRNTYGLIVKAGIPIFKLYSFGFPAKDISYIYQIMSWIEGESIQEYLGWGPEQGDEAHALAGEIFGKLHGITRAYDGVTIQKEPYLMNWKDAFFFSLHSRLNNAIKRPNEFLRSKKDIIESFISSAESGWQDPKEFVLTHTDGLQGMVKFENNRWIFTGVVDIEDHRFHDQRFVLAGYELQSVYNGREVPRVFWEAYQKSKAIDSSYYSLRSLFWLYYILSWFDIPYTDLWRGEEKDKEKIIHKNEELIKKIISAS
ncbi:MAG: hypothetical protein UV01_C0005G0027 [Parcubacteria group bacterium GW2011_GWA2_42_14]|nr:MAG: hypothetical protein UV01_C0005G0027 [Parcubacteria group bacterium GW2011_GWA2_42_14]